MSLENPSFNKSTIDELAQASLASRLRGGVGQFTTNTTNGTLVSKPLDLKAAQNHNLPTLWSIKAARGQRYRHFKTVEDKHIEYPGLYVYLGYNYATALESVQIKNNWVTDGTHPSYLLYADFTDHSASDYDQPLTYKVNEQTGEIDFNTPFNLTWNTMLSIENSFMSADYKTVDGWYELPCPASRVPLYAVCFSGPSQTPCLGLISVDFYMADIQLENPSGMAEVKSYRMMPDFSRFHQAAINSWEGFYNGMIGSPKLMIADNPYSNDPESYFDEDWEKYTWNIFAAGTNMEFIDTTDTNDFAFRPMLIGPRFTGISDTEDQFKYAFQLEIQPLPFWAVNDSSSGAVGENEPSVYVTPQINFKTQLIKKLTADEGDVYQCNIIHPNGYQSKFYMLDPSDEMYEALGLTRTANIVYTEDKCDCATYKGEEILLSVVPDYDGGNLDEIDSRQTMKLILTPVFLDNTQTNFNANVNGILAYYPQIIIWTNAPTPTVATSRIPSPNIINACEIMGQTFNYFSFPGYYRKEGNATFGRFPCGGGENQWRFFGQLCPKYQNVDLESLFIAIPGDSWLNIQPSQYATTTESNSGTMGKFKYQNGSIDLWTVIEAQNHPAKCYYSLYEFATASATDIRDHYEDEQGQPIQPGTDWFGQTAKDGVSIVARVKNNDDEGEVPYIGGNTPSYHLEYLDITQLFDLKRWITGGDETTNYGTSMALKDANGQNTITISIQ